MRVCTSKCSVARASAWPVAYFVLCLVSYGLGLLLLALVAGALDAGRVHVRAWMLAYECARARYCASESPVACLRALRLSTANAAWHGEGCTLQKLLQPLRVIRPVNGGPGWDMDVVMQLRTLNCDLSGDAGAAE
jgi:hypothetical protein